MVKRGQRVAEREIGTYMLVSKLLEEKDLLLDGLELPRRDSKHFQVIYLAAYRRKKQVSEYLFTVYIVKIDLFNCQKVSCANVQPDIHFP